MEKRYLTEEELLRLIEETEQEGLLKAPPGILSSIQEKIENEERKRNVYFGLQKKRQYRQYCIRVASAAAASIVLLFTVPALTPSESPLSQLREFKLELSREIPDAVKRIAPELSEKSRSIEHWTESLRDQFSGPEGEEQWEKSFLEDEREEYHF